MDNIPATLLFQDIMAHIKGMNVEIPKDDNSYDALKCKWYNETEGNLEGIDCQKCRNKGYIAELIDGVEIHKECSCMEERRGRIRMNASGLGGLTERYTFSSYTTGEDWQKRAKAVCLKYVSMPKADNWLFIAGQSGAGKTHLCTAVCNELMKKGLSVRYEVWRELIRKLKAVQYDDTKYQTAMQELRDAECLYIDDFLKGIDRRQLDSDANFAFEIINHRYNANKKTIISSELLIDDIKQIDEALSGRIAEKSKGFQAQIKKEDGRNYRFSERKYNIKGE